MKNHMDNRPYSINAADLLFGFLFLVIIIYLGYPFFLQCVGPKITDLYITDNNTWADKTAQILIEECGMTEFESSPFTSGLSLNTETGEFVCIKNLCLKEGYCKDEFHKLPFKAEVEKK